MPTKRGFVQKLEIGRAGLARVFFVHDNGSNSIYVIRDLDADPERFNERLSKLGILRDAMNRAEPVEIEYVEEEAGQVIERVARISRDALEPTLRTTAVIGFIASINLTNDNKTTANGEQSDRADIQVLTTELTTITISIYMQIPERQVAVAQLGIVQSAYERGDLVYFLIAAEDIGKPSQFRGRVVGVLQGVSTIDYGSERKSELSGFVESLGIIALLPGQTGNFAHVRFTTAPEFTGQGGTIGLSPFTPETFDLLVPKQSASYDLFEAGLRDNLRMRISAIMLRDLKDPDDGDEQGDDDAQPDLSHRKDGLHYVVRALQPVEIEKLGFTFAAELLAHLASASRPVWIQIWRQSLDLGPDESTCLPGVPSSDLSPRSMRDLRIPYPAVWTGLGCFNPGVYRFQLKLPTDAKLSVDGEELCLHDSDEEGFKLAHACLGGEHTVTAEMENWICDYEFVLDAFQLR